VCTTARAIRYPLPLPTWSSVEARCGQLEGLQPARRHLGEEIGGWSRDDGIMGRTLPKRVADQVSPPHQHSGAVGGPDIPTVFGGRGASYVRKYSVLATILCGPPRPMHEPMEGRRLARLKVRRAVSVTGADTRE